MHAIFIEDYDIAVAQQMVQGVDLWINTPRQTWEACGTSGMKVLANGGLNLSSLDGWWAEAYNEEVGWALGNTDNGAASDEREATQLYELLEQQVIPCFYTRDNSGMPVAWVNRIRASISTLTPKYSTNRMLQDYVDLLYLPGAERYQQRTANKCQIARQLKAWYQALEKHWHEVHWGQLEVTRRGNKTVFTVPLYLAEVSAEQVQVQLYANPVPAENSPVTSGFGAAGDPQIIMQAIETIAGSINGKVYSVEIETERPPEDFTPRLVPYFPTASVPLEAPLVSWYGRY
jgi:starch phosphorylase